MPTGANLDASSLGPKLFVVNATDVVGIWNKSGGLWFSSDWNGTSTVEQSLGGGNLTVR